MRSPAKSCCCAILVLLFCCRELPATTPGSSSSIPVRTVHGFLMVAGVTINGRGPFDFAIDTGTNTTLIEPELASELALHPVDRLALTSLANSVPVPRYYLGKLTAGPASVARLEALGTPLPELQSLDRRIRGVLGMNFLMQFSFRLDYRHRRLELWTMPENAPAPEGQRVRIQINAWRILVPVASDAAPRGTWKLALDSGIPQLLVFHGRIRPGAGRCESSACMVKVATNLSGYNAGAVMLPELAIAETRLRNLTAVVLHNDLLSQSDPQDGLLPASLFQSVFFDRSNGTIVLSVN